MTDQTTLYWDQITKGDDRGVGNEGVMLSLGKGEDGERCHFKFGFVSYYPNLPQFVINSQFSVLSVKVNGKPSPCL